MPSTVTTDPTLGRNCSQRRFDQAVDLANQLANIEGFPPIHVWYDGNEDYVRIKFHLEDHNYVISAYKIFSIRREGMDSWRRPLMPSDYLVVEFFERRTYRTWKWEQ